MESDGSVAVTGVAGMGGVGKTALALAVAHQFVSDGRFGDVQLYIDLKGSSHEPLSPETALSRLLTLLLGEQAGKPATLDKLSGLWRGALHERAVLLLLDNATNEAQVRPLLPGSSGCAVIVTSRNRFTLAGRPPLDLEKLLQNDARRLMQRLAPRLNDDEANQVADACGYLPLALQIAGSYLCLNDDCPAAEYATRLSDRKQALNLLRIESDPERDVAASLTLSIEQLDEETCCAWALLALLPGPFGLEEATALWGELKNEGGLLPLDIQVTRDRLTALRNRQPDKLRRRIPNLRPARYAAAGGRGRHWKD